jgi:hypothetical protein
MSVQVVSLEAAAIRRADAAYADTLDDVTVIRVGDWALIGEHLSATVVRELVQVTGGRVAA